MTQKKLNATAQGLFFQANWSLEISALLGYVVYPVLYCQLLRRSVFEFYSYK